MGAASSPVAVMRTTTVSAPPSASGFCALPAPARGVVSERNIRWTGMSLRDMHPCPTSSTLLQAVCARACLQRHVCWKAGGLDMQRAFSFYTSRKRLREMVPSKG